jgi:hypothetical protein
MKRELPTAAEPNNNSRPETQLQALMEAMPGETPEQTSIDIEPLRDAVASIIDNLDEQTRFVIEALFHEQISLGQLGQRLGVSKTHAFRLRNAAYRTLEPVLLEHPLICERLNMKADTWQQAANDSLMNVTNDHHTIPTDNTHHLIVNNMQIATTWYAQHLPPPPPLPDGIRNTLHIIAQSAMRWLSSLGLARRTDIHATLIKKQFDYGHDNILAFGVPGVIIRLNDKIARLENLLSKGQSPLNESVTDTLIDIVGYITIIDMLETDTFRYDLV